MLLHNERIRTQNLIHYSVHHIFHDINDSISHLLLTTAHCYSLSTKLAKASEAANCGAQSATRRKYSTGRD